MRDADWTERAKREKRYTFTLVNNEECAAVSRPGKKAGGDDGEDDEQKKNAAAD